MTETASRRKNMGIIIPDAPSPIVYSDLEPDPASILFAEYAIKKTCQCIDNKGLCGKDIYSRGVCLKHYHRALRNERKSNARKGGKNHCEDMSKKEKKKKK